MTCIGFGQILFRKGAVGIDGERVVPPPLSSPSLWVAWPPHAAATVLRVYVLRYAPLNNVCRDLARIFNFVPTLNWLQIGETFRARSLTGGALILVGVAVAVR